mgnify:FL=1
MDKTTIIYLIMALIIIWAFGYMAYGNDTPTREEMKQNKIEQLKETNARIEMNNKIAESVCETESQEKVGAIERARYKLACLEKDTKPLIDIEKEIEKEFGSGSVVVWTSTASTVAVPEQINLRSIFWLWDCRFTNDNHKLPRYNLEWLAYDIACEKWKAFDVSVPNYQAKEGRNWIVEKIGYGHNMGNFIIIKSNTLRVVYGHTKPIEWIKEWDIVKSTFTIGETDLSGESTWMHLHLEIWEWTDIVSRERFWSPTWEKQDQRKLLEHRKWDFGQKKKILRDGQELEALTYTWNKYGDIDFIKTIEAESRWDQHAVGDSWDAYGYCQINKNFNPEMQTEYRNLKTYQQRIDYCYGQYKAWVDKWVIHKRLYGYNVRNLPQNNKFTFK